MLKARVDFLLTVSFSLCPHVLSFVRPSFCNRFTFIYRFFSSELPDQYQPSNSSLFKWTVIPFCKGICSDIMETQWHRSKTFFFIEKLSQFQPNLEQSILRGRERDHFISVQKKRTILLSEKWENEYLGLFHQRGSIIIDALKLV